MFDVRHLDHTLDLDFAALRVDYFAKWGHLFPKSPPGWLGLSLAESNIGLPMAARSMTGLGTAAWTSAPADRRWSERIRLGPSP